MSVLQEQLNDGWPHGVMQRCINVDDASTHYLLQGVSDNAVMHEETRRIIKQLLSERDGLSERQLALACDMSQTTLNRFLRGNTEALDYANLRSIAQFFDVTVSQLTGEVPLQPDPKIRAVVLAMEGMPEFKKDMLVAASSSLTQSENKRSNGPD